MTPSEPDIRLPSREKIQGAFDVLLRIRHWIRMARIPWPITPGVDIPSSHELEGFIGALYYQYEQALIALEKESAKKEVRRQDAEIADQRVRLERVKALIAKWREIEGWRGVMFNTQQNCANELESALRAQPEEK